MSPIVALRRRTRAERRVLGLLRKVGSVEGQDENARCFPELRRWAQDHGFVIHPLGTPHVSDHEIKLLSWIAHAQRLGHTSALPQDQTAIALILRCAALLSSLSVRLSPFTMMSNKLRSLMS